MAVIKLSKSGKQVQVIDEEGNVFGTSAMYVEGMLNGRIKGNFILLKRLPFKVSKDRFKQSELWDPEGKMSKADSRELTNNNDALSNKFRKVNEQKKKYVDKVIL